MWFQTHAPLETAPALTYSTVLTSECVLGRSLVVGFASPPRIPIGAYYSSNVLQNVFNLLFRRRQTPLGHWLTMIVLNQNDKQQ
jgi:hypothetical protein